jgi:predicted neuraminidase
MRLVCSGNIFRVCFAALMAAFICISVVAQPTGDAIAQQPGFVRSEFVAQEPPTPSSHASTIVETKDDLICAWFGGSRERSPDVSIWAARNEGKGWGPAVEVANGVHDDIRTRYPCWNPVLFRPRNGPLMLFYKEGPSPESWWGMVMTSDDNGQTWSRPKRLFDGFYGPVRNKPIELADGTILAGSSVEHTGWLVQVERTKNVLREWQKTRYLNSSMEWAAIQPTLLPWEDGTIQMLCRTKNGKIVQGFSYDKGMTWSRLKATELPNPNSAIDSVMTRDGVAVLVYNHSRDPDTGRSTLNVATSKDGKKWDAALVLENEKNAEFSYPAVIETSDKKLHVTYTWKRQGIKHVVLDPSQFRTQPIVNGVWPK